MLKKLLTIFSLLILFVACSPNPTPVKKINVEVPKDTSTIINTSSHFENNIITATYKNNSDKKYIFGKKFDIFKFENNKWIEIENNNPYEDIGYYLEPKKEFEDKINLSFGSLNSLDKGYYRIRKYMLDTENKKQYNMLKDEDYEKVDIIFEVK